MTCNRCQSDASMVIETRTEAQYIRRRRECKACGHRWTTVEIEKGRYTDLKWVESKYGELRLLLENEL